MTIPVGEYEVELTENYDLREDCDFCESLACFELRIAQGRAVSCEDENHQQSAAAEALDRAHSARIDPVPTTF